MHFLVSVNPKIGKKK